MNSTRPTNPRSLKIVGLLILLWSILHLALSVYNTWCAHVPGSTEYHISFDFSAISFLATIGLALRWRAGRALAFLFSWYWLLGAWLLALELYPIWGIIVTSNSDFLDPVPKEFLHIFVFPFLVSQFWQLHVLRRPDVRALFYPVPQPQGPPTMSYSSSVTSAEAFRPS